MGGIKCSSSTIKLRGYESIPFLCPQIFYIAPSGMLFGNDYELLPMSMLPNKFREPTSVPNIFPLPNKVFPLSSGFGFKIVWIKMLITFIKIISFYLVVIKILVSLINQTIKKYQL